MKEVRSNDKACKMHDNNTNISRAVPLTMTNTHTGMTFTDDMSKTARERKKAQCDKNSQTPAGKHKDTIPN